MAKPQHTEEQLGMYFQCGPLNGRMRVRDCLARKSSTKGKSKGELSASLFVCKRCKTQKEQIAAELLIPEVEMHTYIHHTTQCAGAGHRDLNNIGRRVYDLGEVIPLSQLSDSLRQSIEM